MRIIFLLFIFSILSSKAKSQVENLDYPKIGSLLPSFNFNDVEHFKSSIFNPSDFRGKWLVLDFWHEYCVPCITKMPEIQSIQDKYSNDAQFIFVGMVYKTRETISNLFQKLKKRYNLNIPIAYDSLIYKRFGISSAPAIIVVDPYGVVRAITYQLTINQLDSLINRKSVDLPRVYLNKEIITTKYLLNQSFLSNEGIADSNYIYNCILRKWTEGYPGYTVFVKKNRLDVFKLDLKSLYRLAYIGKEIWYIGDSLYSSINIDPILLINDSSYFKTDNFSSKNYFIYSTTSKVDTAFDLGYFSKNILNDQLKIRMQRDLKNIFNYDVTIEERTVPYYKLIKNSHFNDSMYSTLYTSHVEQPDGGSGGISAKNISIQLLLAYVSSSPGAPSVVSGITFKDETGITQNIDLSIRATFFDEWIVALKNIGFDLVLASKRMNCIVIRDPSI